MLRAARVHHVRNALLCQPPEHDLARSLARGFPMASHWSRMLRGMSADGPPKRAPCLQRHLALSMLLPSNACGIRVARLKPIWLTTGAYEGTRALPSRPPRRSRQSSCSMSKLHVPESAPCPPLAVFQRAPLPTNRVAAAGRWALQHQQIKRVDASAREVFKARVAGKLSELLAIAIRGGFIGEHGSRNE